MRLNQTAMLALLVLMPATAQAALLGNGNATFPGSAEIMGALPENATAGHMVGLAAADNTAADGRGLWAGQTFQVTSAFQLGKIYIEYAGATAGQSINLYIRNATGLTADSLALDSIVWDGTYTFTSDDATATAGANRVMEFSFTGADSVNLATGGYFFQIEGADDNTAATDFNWYRTVSGATGGISPYAPGRAYSTVGGTTGRRISSGDGREFTFAVTAAVPEPSTIALVTIGGVLALGMLRRRTKSQRT